MATVEEIQKRISELTAGKEALLQRGAEIEERRDQSSTYSVLLNKDADGLKMFEELSNELITVAAKVRAFDIALVVEEVNLRDAQRLLDLEADREQALQAQTKWAEFHDDMTALEFHLDVAMERLVSAYQGFMAARDLGVQFPTPDQFRVAIISMLQKAPAKPMVQATASDDRFGAAVYRQIADEFNVGFTAPSQRRPAEHFLTPWGESVARQLAARGVEPEEDKQEAA